jgi:hypothetical protein
MEVNISEVYFELFPFDHALFICYFYRYSGAGHRLGNDNHRRRQPGQHIEAQPRGWIAGQHHPPDTLFARAIA